GKPLKVFINLNVNDISSISEMKMEFSTTLYLRQVWKDERLAYSESDRNITLHHKQFDRMWTPDVFIRNLKSGSFHTITVPNRLIRLSPDGTILYSQRLTLTLACDMILNKYPMDNQTCKIEFGSYAYTTEDLEFEWRTDATAVEVNEAISLPEYELKDVSHVVCSQNIKSTGSFPCLRAYFHLERRLKAYVLSTFLPSLLVVLLSWVSFWIDLDAVPARISLGILTMLTMTTQSSGHMRGVPAVSFTKAIDVWMATCLVFVFGSFIEYSVVNVLARKEKAEKLRKARSNDERKGENVSDEKSESGLKRVLEDDDQTKNILIVPVDAKNVRVVSCGYFSVFNRCDRGC
ncbi:hypothetical protein HELRODRAFT_77867, partial [Helobdella robusta]|uniref:Uncharacterized protein n=1 Tax=Helobdella robusta TaxID=6412 RepID=T1G350_HELRO